MTLGVVFLFLIGGVMTLLKAQYYKAGPLAEAICLKVEPGSSMSMVAVNLKDKGAVRSKELFNIGADYTDKSARLKAGSFLIPAGASMAEIADQITTSGRNTCGTEVVYRVGVTRSSVLVRELDPVSNSYEEVARFTPAEEPAPQAYSRVIGQGDTRIRLAIAEGTTSWQVVEALKSIDFLTGDIAQVPAEGLLAPDSYEIKAGDARQDLLARMLQEQERRLAEVWAQRSDATPVETMEELLILASIIEKETGVADERFTVASVFANRLEKGMPLQTDPTVIYGVTGGKGALGRGLRRSELDRETPYNTYKIAGLPPTPIANPGRASILAALNPDRTEDLYFVADGTGGHAFAASYDAHLKNVAKWRAIEAEAAKSKQAQ